MNEHFAQYNLSEPSQSIVSWLVFANELAAHFSHAQIRLKLFRVAQKQFPQQTFNVFVGLHMFFQYFEQWLGMAFFEQ